MNDLDSVIDEVCRVVEEHLECPVTHYKTRKDAIYVYRLVWSVGRGVVGEVRFGHDRARVCSSEELRDEVIEQTIGDALYCDPDFFKKIVEIVDKL